MRIQILHSRIVRVAFAALMVVLIASIASGCRNDPLKRQTRILGKRVEVVVTADGGKHLIVKHNLRIQTGQTALEALRGVADVRLDPDGNVVQINGQGGGRLSALGPERASWFYRVDGVESNIDPSRFRLRPGMSLWWDLRRHDIYQRIPVAIGVFPEPLLNGYRDDVRRVRITYSKGFSKDANAFEELLQKVVPEQRPLQDTSFFDTSAGDALHPVAHVAVRRSSTNVVIGRWEDIRLDPYIADIGLDPRAYGLTVWIEGHDIRRQNPDEEISTELKHAEGIVWASTIDGEPDSPIVIAITGVTDAGVHAAAKALLTGRMQYYLAGVVDAKGKVVP